MTTRTYAAAAAAVLLATAPAFGWAAKPPATWDDLVIVKSKRMDAVYLLPGADFRPYTKILLDPTEVAFRKNWVRDYNNSTVGLSQRISEADAKEAMELVRAGFEESFRKTYTSAGYELVTEPGPDVLRVRTAVINIAVSAPDQQTIGRSRTYAQEAGEATLVLEVRDSESGAILGRAVDRRIAGDTTALMRNSITNRGDFNRLFTTWAKASVDGLARLKSMGAAGVTPQ